MRNSENRWAVRQPDEASLPQQPANPALRVVRRVATLDRRAPNIVRQAHEVDVDITYLGIAPLFDEPRAYGGPTTDWVIAPVTAEAQEVVPRRERQTLQRLIEASIDFPLVYVAHELPKGRLDVPEFNSAAPIPVDRAAVRMAAIDVPAPMTTVELSQRLGRSSAQLLAVIGKALPIAGAVVAAPFVVAGAALGALARLDPIILEVVPDGAGAPGEPAAWFVVARWNW